MGGDAVVSQRHALYLMGWWRGEICARTNLMWCGRKYERRGTENYGQGFIKRRLYQEKGVQLSLERYDFD